MAHLVQLLAMGVLGIEGLFRPRLARAVPGLAELEADPAGYLAAVDGVRIGPRRHPLVSPLVGMPLGAFVGVFAGLVGLVLFADHLGRGPEVADRMMLGGAAVGALLGWPFVWHVSRGGELVLLPSGVAFTYRGKDVFCPWGALDSGRPVEHTDEVWSRLPVHPERVEAVALIVRGAVRRTGAAVSAVHAGFDQPGLLARLRGSAPEPPRVIAVRDVYAVRREELFDFLVRIAPRCVSRS